MQAIEGVKIFELRNPVSRSSTTLASQEKAWSRSPSPACTIAATQQTRRSALVRLRVSVHRRVRVPLWRSFPPVTESNCVVATRGGEQLEVNG